MIGFIVLLFVLGIIGIFIISSYSYHKSSISKELIDTEVLSKKIEYMPAMHHIVGLDHTSFYNIYDKVVYLIEFKDYNEIIEVDENLFKNLYIGEKIDLIINTEYYVLKLPFFKPKYLTQKRYEVRSKVHGKAHKI